MLVVLDYYEQRAPHCDAVYERPDRRADLARLGELIPAEFPGRHVLEVAAGTGYWTVAIAEAAATVHATDANPGENDLT
ncbi:hypothetical protein GCM10022255_064800 [Dactylosporangium darangshiense]|uniref:Methyltransferase n=1 Tax=Dactylosporangium darangshiense TaxID=579108 RepID=A0ABP8DGP1_9ACTN